LLVGTSSAAALSYAAVTISARLLGPEDFGLLGALLGITSLATVGVTWVYATAAHVAATALARRDIRSLTTLIGPVLAGSTVFGLLTLTLLLALAHPVGDVLHTTDPWVIGLLAPLLAAIICGQVLKGFLSGLQRFPAFSAAITFEALGRAVLTTPLVLLFGVAGSLASYAGGVVMADAWVLTRFGSIGWRVPLPEELVGTGWTAVGTAMTTLMVAMLQYSDLVLLRWYAPANEVGIYSAAAALGNTLFTLAVPLTLPAFPRALAAYHARQPTTPILLRALIPVVLGGLAAVLGATWLGGVTAVVIFGSPFAEVGALLPVYFAKTTALIVLALTGQHVVAVRRFGALLAAALLTLLGPLLIATLRPSPEITALLVFAVATAAAVLIGLVLAIPTPRAGRTSPTLGD
jgi:O-antigen/teichoic acid export membrane protein